MENFLEQRELEPKTFEGVEDHNQVARFDRMLASTVTPLAHEALAGMVALPAGVNPQASNGRESMRADSSVKRILTTSIAAQTLRCRRRLQAGGSRLSRPPMLSSLPSEDGRGLVVGRRDCVRGLPCASLRTLSRMDRIAPKR